MAKLKNAFAKRSGKSFKAFAPKVERAVERKRGMVYSIEDAHKLSIEAFVKDGSITFVTKGRWISLNDIISKSSYMSEKGIKEIIVQKIRESVKGVSLKIDKFVIVVRYNAKLDDHNTVMMPKYFTDAIKKSYLKIGGRYIRDVKSNDKKAKVIEFEGIIEDDDARFSCGTILIPDKSLPINTFIMTYQKASNELGVKIAEYATNG